MLLNSVATTRPGTGLVLAEAVDFDGANDYLSRSSDLTGNADGKTFTFSAWVWKFSTTGGAVYGTYGAGFPGLEIIIDNTGNLSLYAHESGGVQILGWTVPGIPNLTPIHILCSFDLSNTSKRFIYINDVLQTVGFSPYTNTNINFTNTAHYVAYTVGRNAWNGRLAHVFLDYQYRDLSIEANRRLFITSDRKPVNKSILTALNPILYLPMDDPSTAHVNAGTGGNFTLNGTIARSGRGPNQFNAPYSTLNGSSGFLYQSNASYSLTNNATFFASINFSQLKDEGYLLLLNVSGVGTVFGVRVDSNGQLTIDGYYYNGSGLINVFLVQTTTGYIKAGRNYSIAFSVTSGVRHLYVNGVNAASMNSYGTGTAMSLGTLSPIYVGRAGSVSSYINGRLGNVFFDTRYIDLSQPANLAKFVTGTGIDAKPVDMGANGELPLVVQPLIYLPMYGNNAGKNYGSGGDFTVNSGPYTGARGPNEFWGNKANFNGTTGYLSRTSALSGVSDGNKFVCSFTVNLNAINVNYSVVSFNLNGINIQVSSSTNKIDLRLRNSSGSQLVDATTATALAAGTTYTFLICVDLSNSSKRAIYINGVLDSTTWNVYQDGSIYFSAPSLSIGARSDAALFVNGFLSEFYLTTDYIDFSQEANRLKFRDAFGNPVDLTPQIQAGTLPNPAIYMRFDPADQGKNSGTGGNFTKTGTIADGGQL